MLDTTEDESPPVVTAAGVNGYHHLHHQPRWSKANLTSSSAEREPLMMMDLDLDLDLEAPWLLDVSTTTSTANPTPSFLLSAASEQPCSPLWGYSDENNGDKTNGNYVSGGSFYPKLFSYITDTVTPDPGQENTTTNEEKKKPPLPNLSITQLSDSSCIIKERMTQALRYFKESHSTGQHVLAQVWAPVKTGTKYELTTSGQPFVVDPNSNGLHQYRMMSLMYKFSVDGETNGVLGLPGRVFRQKLPEWTPNVQYYSSKEFSRLNHALHYNVQGTLALPVFEPTGQSCIGVLELIMTSPKIHYAPDVDKVCKALELVNLRSSEILDQPNTQISNEGRQNALVEILEILTVLCESHKLPLAQTWVPCRHRSVLAYGGGLMKSCSSFDGHCMGQICMSTTEVAFYLVDAHMWGFREACAEHHLQKGQGVAGRAFSSHGSCFCPDITKFCKTEYPLVHYARMFGLSGSFAICLQSSYTGDDEYVLEFFLPPSVSDHRDQRNLLDSLLMMMKPHFRSLRSASGKEIEHEWNSVEVIMASMNEKVEEVENSKMGFESFEEQHIVVTYNALNGGGNGGGGGNSGGGVQNVVGSVLETKGVVKKPERKRGKAEKTISLEVLQQYFAGSLKDAAKSLGVCPTTMKRICRQHGISRWPSRKINKVNRSLSKLKRVIESVQGTEGTFALTSLASSSLPVAVGSISWPASMNGPGPVPTGPTSSQQQYSPGSKPPFSDEFYPHKIPLPDEHMLKNERSSESGEESTGTPTSEASCQGSPGQDNPGPVNVGPLPLPNKQTDRPSINLSAIFSTPEAFVSTHNQEAFRGILIEDAGSSQDLRNLGENLEYSWTNPGPSGPVGPDIKVPKFSARPEMKTVTIKATYKEDIIRFRILRNSGIDKLKEEVAKRLKLEMGSFEIKYLDDDHEWVLIACDVDLQECVEISRSSGGNIIRLLVHDMMTILGSSCESSG